MSQRKRLNKRIARRIAWSLVGVFILLATAGVGLQAVSNTPYINTPFPALIILILLVTVWIITGALIVSRHPRHPVGWLLCAGMFFPALDMLAAGYAAYDTYTFSGSLPGVDLAFVWLKLGNLGAIGLTAFILIILLFPDGRFLSHGWRRLAWIAVGALLLLLPLQALEPGPADPYFLPSRVNPFGVSADLWALLKPFLWAAFSILVLCYGAAFVSLIVRFRSSRGDTRQQVKWLLFPVGLYGVFLVMFMTGNAVRNETFLASSIVLGQLAVAGQVIAIAFGIFKYRLYDIDLIVNRTLVYGALTASVVVLYVLVVGAGGLVIQANSQLAGLLITCVLLGMGYRPFRALLQRGADRFVPVAPPFSDSPVLPSKKAANPDLEDRISFPQEKRNLNRLQSWPQAFFRAMWYFWAIIAWGIFILAVPAQIGMTSAGLQSDPAAPIPTWGIYAIEIGAVLTQLASSLIALVLAAVLFVKRAGDKMALFTSYFLLVTGIVLVPLNFLEPYWPGAHRLTYAVIQPVIYGPLLVIFLSIFPNGRFEPPWTRRLAWTAVLYAPIGTLFLTKPAYNEPTRVFILAVFLWFALILTGFYAQIIRYRKISNPFERQQAKWVVYGFSLEALLAILLTANTIAFKQISPGAVMPWWSPFQTMGWNLAFAILPISLTLAVMRYRLFTIDLLINRTLVYGALSAGVMGIYGLVVGGTSVLSQSSGNLVVALIATGLVAVLFQPLRERLQRAVNRLMYGERDDPLVALSRLGQRLEAAIAPDVVLPTLVETIAQTLKLPFVAIRLRTGNESNIAAQIGKETVKALELPLIYQGETMGWLIAGPRGPEDPLNQADRHLLSHIARQAGPAVHAIKLNAELQHSRQLLVTAIEEERRRLRRDLHDGLGATLAALHLEAGALRRAIHSDPQKAESVVNEFRADIRSAIDDIRRLVYELRPPTLDQLGLAAAVRAQAAACSRRDEFEAMGLQIRVQAPEEFPPLPAAVEVAAYRIAQEAMTNVVSHSQARWCDVRLELANGTLVMEIMDDGVGIGTSLEKSGGNSGIGLLSMRERALELGGNCFIEPAAGGGTRVYASLPVPQLDGA